MIRKLMSWNPQGENTGKLYVLSDSGYWMYYKMGLPDFLIVQDFPVPGSRIKASDGFATMQLLMKNGWIMVNGKEYGTEE